VEEYRSIIIIFFGSCICIAILGILYLIFNSLRLKIKLILYKIKSWKMKLLDRIQIIKSINFVLKNKQNDFAQEIVFQLFIHFYETNKDDIDNWKFDKDCAPVGKTALTNLYKWITFSRHMNLGVLDELEWNDKDESFEYWGAKYKSFKFGINKGALEIYPSDTPMSDIEFRVQKMKIQNVLYDLDSAKCNWVIKRRKYFKI
jgi:hypothetical protein